MTIGQILDHGQISRFWRADDHYQMESSDGIGLGAHCGREEPRLRNSPISGSRWRFYHPILKLAGETARRVHLTLRGM